MCRWLSEDLRGVIGQTHQIRLDFSFPRSAGARVAYHSLLFLYGVLTVRSTPIIMAHLKQMTTVPHHNSLVPTGGTKSQADPLVWLLTFHPTRLPCTLSLQLMGWKALRMERIPSIQMPRNGSLLSVLRNCSLLPRK